MLIELTEIEQEKAAACIMLQVIKFDIQADKLRNKPNTLTEAETEQLCKLEQRVDFYRALAEKIRR